MINRQNKKKIIAIAVIIGIFILYIIFVLIFSKPRVEESPDVPIGDHGQADVTDKSSDSYITINEKENDLSIAAIELLHAIKTPSMSLNSFGEYYIYDGYYVFPKRQIKIKKSYDQILSIVFFDEYKGEIIKGINVNTSNSNIVSKIGTPNYNENNLLVYKTKDCYISFDTERKQVAAYLRNQNNFNEFWQLYDIYLQNNNLKRFIADITKKYPTYTQYFYDVDGLELIYADYGIRLYFKEKDNENGIYIYSNYYSDNEEYSVENLQKKTNVKYKNYNLIMKEEIERVTNEQNKKNFSWPEKVYSDNDIYKYFNVNNSYLEKVEATETEQEYKILKKLSKYTVYYETNRMNYTFGNVSIISKINNNNFNINTAKVADYLLATDEFLFYSITNEGIFRININTGAVVELHIGEGSFELKYIKSNYLYFDDVKIKAL